MNCKTPLAPEEKDSPQKTVAGLEIVEEIIGP